MRQTQEQEWEASQTHILMRDADEDELKELLKIYTSTMFLEEDDDDDEDDEDEDDEFDMNDEPQQLVHDIMMPEMNEDPC
jgi:hypothetical protein